MAKDINIGGRLHSIATGNVIAGADEILDDNLGKKQTQINTETYSLVESVNNALDALNPDQQEALGVAAKANANEAKLGYYVCDTDANTAAKTIAATNYVLGTGGSIKVKMINDNTVDSATLNINSTGAKPLFYEGVRASSTNTWVADDILEIYYDGTNYQARNISPTFKTGEKVNSVGVDDEPIVGSENVVKSGGVYKEFASREREGPSFDFTISDKNGYDVVRFKNGHIKTKEFDSSQDASQAKRGLMSAHDKEKLDWINVSTDDTRFDFEIVDENGYAILRIENGILKTKNTIPVDIDGIIPKGTVTQNSYTSNVEPDGYILTKGICTQRNPSMLEDCLITSLHFYANGNGKIHLGIGSIDQRDWAIVIQEFDVDCIEGVNDVDITKLGIVGVREGVLFVYNNYYGDGITVGYVNRTNSSENEYIYSDTVDGKMAGLDGTGADLALSYKQCEDKLLYDLRTIAEDGRNEVDEIINKVAYTQNSYHEVVGDDGNLYKLSVDVNGNVVASAVNYQKITIFGNSIWSHRHLKSYLPDVVDEDGTWTYYPTDPNEDTGMDSRGMAATLQDYDFKHLFRTGIRSSYPNCVIQGANIAGIERTLPQSIYSSLGSVKDILLANDVDVIIWRAGENVSTLDGYADALRRYIVEFKQHCPKAKIIFTGRFWLNKYSDNAVKEVCEEFNLPYIKLYKEDEALLAKKLSIQKYPVRNTVSGVVKDVYHTTSSGGGHPSDLGMLYIANKLLLSLNQMPLLITHKVNVDNNTSVELEYFSKCITGELYSLICHSENISVTIEDSEGNAVSDVLVFTNSDGIGVPSGCKIFSFIVPNDDIYITVNN